MPRAAFKDAAFKEHISQLLKQYIDPENKDWLVTVVELPDKDITPGAPHVASFAIWDMTSTSNSANKSAVGKLSSQRSMRRSQILFKCLTLRRERQHRSACR
jgi:hypothetical protein